MGILGHVQPLIVFVIPVVVMDSNILADDFDDLGGSPLLAWLVCSFLEKDIQNLQL